MTRFQFFATCLKDAFAGGWALANSIASVLALAGGFVTWRWPSLGGGINFLMWAVPSVALVLFIYCGSLLAAYRLYQHQSQLIAKQVSETDKSERQRRQNLYDQLRQEYMLSHDGLSPKLIAGLEPIPADWVNSRLTELGEQWRV